MQGFPFNVEMVDIYLKKVGGKDRGLFNHLQYTYMFGEF